ncbi:sigma factor-like helix-turn-helix DNA-binding protein [Bacillus tianshenii]|nr:sigma factor-like helix-turn-helix DNA-binding protein [Bacillus tianshenii]
MQSLIREYKQSLKQVNATKRTLKNKLERIEDVEKITQLQKDISLLNSMERDIAYSLQWMRTARCPESRRGAERRGYDQLTFQCDPLVLDKTKSEEDALIEARESQVTDADRELMNEAMWELSEREKEVFTMSEVAMLSNEEIAEALSIRVSSVKTYKIRARQKLDRWMNQRRDERECS